MVLRFSAGLPATLLFAFYLGAALPAMAKDCAPVGHLPSYEAGDEHFTRDYDQEKFQVQKSEDVVDEAIAGSVCKQAYFPKSGIDPLSDLEIQMNYRDQLGKLGAQILFTDNRNTTAKLVKGTEETWISVYSQETEIDVRVVEKKPIQLTLTTSSGNDYRLLGHMPAYEAGEPEKRNFDKATFTVPNGKDDTQDVEVVGAKYVVNYTPKDDAATQSDLAIQTNYRAALKKLGADILWTDNRNTTARLIDNGKSIWIKVYSQESEIDVTVIEEKPFEASIQPPTADAMKAALEKDGHIALYIRFDFNKSTLRPDAKPIIDQIVALMKNNPGLKVEVDGHTDNIGSHNYNMKLSQDRAAAVLSAVVVGGIDKSRIKSAGFGPDKPIADNTKEEGRAKNRRVELVKL